MSRRRNKLMAFFDYKVFADESGNDPARSHFVHAGYISTVERWDALTEEWDRCLKGWGVDPFHMAEAEALAHEFSGWTEAEKNERVLLLSEIVERHTMMGFSCDMKWSDWNKIAARKKKMFVKKIAKLSRSPYMASLHYFLMGVANKCDASGIRTKDVKLVIAEQGKIWERDWTAITRLCESLGFCKPSFEPAKDFAPLQACDMLAWTVFQLCSNRAKYRPTPARLEPLLKRLFVLRITEKILALPMLEIEFRILQPGEVPRSKPIGTLEAQDVHDFRLIGDDENEDGEDAKPAP